MLTPSDIRPGLVLRVILAHGLGAPRGTLATVESIETSRTGDWCCVVTYHNMRVSRRGTQLYRSHLWANDLGRFEIVTDVGEATGKAQRRGKAEPIRQPRIQLALPFPPDDDDYISNALISSS
jgi:hypothetical protein